MTQDKKQSWDMSLHAALRLCGAQLLYLQKSC